MSSLSFDLADSLTDLQLVIPLSLAATQLYTMNHPIDQNQNYRSTNPNPDSATIATAAMTAATTTSTSSTAQANHLNQPNPCNPPNSTGSSCQPDHTQPPPPPTQSSDSAGYPHQVHGVGGPTATAPFLRDFSLVAEAARRAQVSVMTRDLEGVTL